jgi:hypothetical protein
MWSRERALQVAPRSQDRLARHRLPGKPRSARPERGRHRAPRAQQWGRAVGLAEAVGPARHRLVRAAEQAPPQRELVDRPEPEAHQPSLEQALAEARRRQARENRLPVRAPRIRA